LNVPLQLLQPSHVLGPFGLERIERALVPPRRMHAPLPISGAVNARIWPE
jgi:hypothetical protein